MVGTAVYEYFGCSSMYDSIINQIAYMTQGWTAKISKGILLIYYVIFYIFKVGVN